MADLLPSSPDVEPRDGTRVVGIDSDEADDLIGALSSKTARNVLAELHEDPAAPSALADRVDTSLQNVQYHLGNLEEAGLVEVADTVYSEKGREMNVYAPADRALVVVAGRDEETSGLRSVLSRLLGGIGVLALGSVVVDRLARSRLSARVAPTGGAGGDAADGEADVAVANATATEQTTATQVATDAGESGGGELEIAEVTTTQTPRPTGTTSQTVAESASQTGTPTPTDAVEYAATATPPSTPTPAPTPQPTTVEGTRTVVETTTGAAGGGLAELLTSPGVLFFLGGATVLVAGVVGWWVTRR